MDVIFELKKTAKSLLENELKTMRYIDVDKITKNKIAARVECKAMILLDMDIFTQDEYDEIIKQIRAYR